MISPEFKSHQNHHNQFVYYSFDESPYQSLKRRLELGSRRRGKRRRLSVGLRWFLGRWIEAQRPPAEAKAVLKDWLDHLSARLSADLGPGFSRTALRRMHAFYRAFPNWDPQLSALSWSHYRLLLGLSDRQARWFYLRAAVAGGWSTRELRRQIGSGYFERAQRGTAPGVPPLQALLKEPYIFEFLEKEAAERLLEKDLESALLDQLQDFLLELGEGFSFVARQKRIVAPGGKAFYIDLVFYHFAYKCFVLIDLKITPLRAADVGQLDLYVRLYDEQQRQPGDQPTAGILLSPEIDPALRRYTALHDSERLFAATYRLSLPEDMRIDSP